MFRKIVTELAYSPALAEELAIYSRGLRRVKTKRQIGLLFLALGFAIQLLVTVSPPESANASNPTAFIEGGLRSIDDYLGYYDNNSENIKDLLDSLGITRADVQATELEQLDQETAFYMWNKASRQGSDDTPYTFQAKDQTTKVAYHQFAPLKELLPHKRSDGIFLAFTGSSPSVGRFAILKSSGNLLTESVRQSSCQTGPLALYIPETTDADVECPEFTASLSGSNITTNSPIDDYSANASDRILYALTIHNTSDTVLSVPLHIQLEDLLEYAQILDKGGGELDVKTKSMTWPTASLAPGETLTRDFIVQLLPTIPSTARGQYNRSSYDCIASVSFGNTLHMPVVCPFTKTIEQVIEELPQLPASTGLAFITGTTLLAIYFFARTRQLLAELRRIQRSQPGGI